MEPRSNTGEMRSSARLSRNARFVIGQHMLQFFKDERFGRLDCGYYFVRSSSGILTYSQRELEPTTTDKCYVKAYRTSKGDVRVKLLEAAVVPRDFISDTRFEKMTYFISNSDHWIGLTDLNVAVHLARLIVIKRRHIDRSFHNAVLSYFWEDTVKVTPDNEYARACGLPPLETTVTVPVKAITPYQPSLTEVAPALYSNFEAVMDSLMENRGEANYSKAMGNTKTLSRISTPWTASLECYKMKRALSPQEWVAKSRGRIPAVSYQFPKPESITSDGNPRMVVALEPTLEAWLRLFWDGVNFDSLPGYVRRPSDLRNDLKYSYDIRSSDDVVGPYFRKYVESKHRRVSPLLFPRVVGRNGPYNSAKLPSGVPHTAIVTNAFCYALLKTLGITRFQFQGDGFITDQAITHPLLRRNEDHVLNGFKNFDGRVRFVNTEKLGRHVYVRHGKINGELRYRIRYSCYHHLDAVGLDKFPKPIRGILTPQQIQSLCDEQQYIVSAVTGVVQYGKQNCETTVRSADSACLHCDCSSLVYNTTA